MADTVKKCAYFSMDVPNRRGEGARILSTLAKAGVNLIAFTGFPHGRKAQVDFVPDRTAAFLAAARKAKLKISARKTCFLVQGGDRTGAVASVLGKLAKAGINVTAIDAVSAGKKRYAAILWVKPKDVSKAARTMRAK